MTVIRRSASFLARLTVCATLATALGLSPRVARAAEPTAESPAAAPESKSDPELDRAMRSYDLGSEAYNDARFEDALGHFQTAASLYGSPDFQYNIGLCYEMLGEYKEAIRSFETYLRAKPDAADRPAVESRIAKLKSGTPPQARPEGSRAPDPADQPKQPSPEEVLASADWDEKQRQAETMILTGAIVTGIGGAVAIVGGVAFGVLARNRSNAVDDVTEGGNPDDLTFAETQDLEDEGVRFERVQIGMVAGGAAVAVIGAVVLAIGLKRKKALQSGASAAFVPTFGRGRAGIALQGKF